MPAVVDRRNASDHSTGPPGEEQLAGGMLEERVLRLVDQRVRVTPQRRCPERIAAVEPIREADERAEVRSAGHSGNLEVAHALFIHRAPRTSRLFVGKGLAFCYAPPIAGASPDRQPAGAARAYRRKRRQGDEPFRTRFSWAT